MKGANMNFRTVDSARRWGKKGWALYYATLADYEAILADYEMLFEQSVKRDLETLRDPDLPRLAKSRQEALARIRMVKSTPAGKALVAVIKLRIGYVPRRFPPRRGTTARRAARLAQAVR
jgi:hypothetical protein